MIHEALNFGHCHLALGVPMGGRFAGVESLEDLRALGWTAEQPLRVVTGARVCVCLCLCVFVCAWVCLCVCACVCACVCVWGGGVS